MDSLFASNFISTILDKTFGTLSHLHIIRTFSNNPPSPLDSVGCYWPKLLKNLLKCMNFNFVKGGREKPNRLVINEEKATMFLNKHN